MLSIPWWGYHFIKIRHNQKLAYWMLACSWLSIEWLAGQFWMSWNGFQLGIILSDIDVFVQCYDLIGISGGSLWIIILNIQIFRLLFSEKEKPIKGNLINLAFIFFIPIMLSVYLLYFGKTIEKDGNTIKVLAQNVVANAQDCNPDEDKLSEKKLNPAVLKTYPCDIIALETTRDEEDFKISASFKSKSDSSFNPIQSKTLRTNDIFGISKKELTVLELAHLKINAIGNFQVIRSEFFRLNCKSNQNLIICCSTALQKPTFTLLKIARLRAIENRKNIILFDSNNNVYGFQPSGKTTKLKIENATFETDKTSTSFYGQYGDLVGRLSLFISAWLLLGTFTKTDRNNFK